MHAWFQPGKISRFIDRVWPVALAVFCFALPYGLYLALYASPVDYQQGETVRIMYMHVPAAWLALGIYVLVGSCGIAYLVWKNPLSVMMAVSALPVGAGFALICLVTGSLWGKPMWGTWWVWDARLTSMLVLFFFYLALIFLYSAHDNKAHAGKMMALLSVVGLVNIPVVKFSVDWWNTLHQPASVFRKGGVAIDPAMLSPLLWMGVACFCLFLCLFILRLKTEILHRKLENRQHLL